MSIVENKMENTNPWDWWHLTRVYICRLIFNSPLSYVVCTGPEKTNFKQEKYTSTIFAFFGTFLHVEQEFIPKKSVASCPLEGRANQGRPIQPFCPNGLDWPAMVSPALQRTWSHRFLGYILLFYMQKGPKKCIICRCILFLFNIRLFRNCERFISLDIFSSYRTQTSWGY